MCGVTEATIQRVKEVNFETRYTTVRDIREHESTQKYEYTYMNTVLVYTVPVHEQHTVYTYIYNIYILVLLCTVCTGYSVGKNLPFASQSNILKIMFPIRII